MYQWRHVVRLTRCRVLCAKSTIMYELQSSSLKLCNSKCLGIWVKCANELKMNKSSWILFNAYLTEWIECSLCSKHFTTSKDWAELGGTEVHSSERVSLQWLGGQALGQREENSSHSLLVSWHWVISSF